MLLLENVAFINKIWNIVYYFTKIQEDSAI